VLCLVADQVDHARRSEDIDRPQWQAADRSDELLELAGGASIDRPMAGVVWPRRHLVGQHAAVARNEHLECDQTDQAEAFGQLQAALLGCRLNGWWQPAGNDRRAQDAVTMIVETDWKAACLPVKPTRDDGRDLALEIHQRFQDAFPPVKPVPCRRQLPLGRNPDLALAVIAVSASLEDAGKGRGGGDIVFVRNPLVFGGPEPRFSEELLLAQPMLGQMDRSDAGPYRPVARTLGHRGFRHVLEFVGDDVDFSG